MSSAVFTSVIRFVALLLIQVLILKRLSFPLTDSIHLNIFLYPLFIFLLPFRTPQTAILLLAFFMGLGVDYFYDSFGVHASALVFTAAIRPFILARLSPRDGYNLTHSPTMKRMGFSWFLTYISLLLGIHLLWYFSVEAFTFVYIGDILLKSVSSFVVSMTFIFMVTFLFNPMD